ncbi:MAG TPA: alternative ribosome rescue aminoacyl-tRNA hydrolase ArfB [Kofleriaceae bacterium]|nr:alternative ribosome rescue aminoacyl-tRNA hydrolase ArfB [Kofleriaceae bacterium]
MDDLIIGRLRIPGDELTIGFARSGGPGGQNVNKVETKVELRWRPAGSAALAPLSDGERAWLLGRLRGRLTDGGELIVTSTLTRNQARNRADALDKLAAIVAAALRRPKPRRKTRPSRGAVERRIAAKKRRGRAKADRRGGADD